MGLVHTRYFFYAFNIGILGQSHLSLVNRVFIRLLDFSQNHFVECSEQRFLDCDVSVGSVLLGDVHAFILI